MSISFTHTIDIPEPAERVFAVIDDPVRTPEWLARCVVMEKLTPGPVKVGTLLRYSFRDAGREGVMEGEVTEREENARLAMHFADRQMAATIGFRVEPTATGCSLTHSIELQPLTLATRVFAPLIRRQVPKQTIRAMEALRSLVHDPHA